MSESKWSMPYCGYEHRREGILQLTVCKRSRFVEAYIVNRANLATVVKKLFDNVEDAKSWLEKKAGVI